MINQHEVAAYLTDELPQIKDDLKQVSPTLNMFKSSQCLTANVPGKAGQQDLRIVKKCFGITEHICPNGNDLIKTAIENVVIMKLVILLT